MPHFFRPDPHIHSSALSYIRAWLLLLTGIPLHICAAALFALRKQALLLCVQGTVPEGVRRLVMLPRRVMRRAGTLWMMHLTKRLALLMTSATRYCGLITSLVHPLLQMSDPVLPLSKMGSHADAQVATVSLLPSSKACSWEASL